ncbi:UDP-GalNAc:beta-1,3-N-acetylgalactosaminyltransferase 2-like [Varroa jacobsoni]|nr:UDP-GalNAc:beta-1,3-N-acetylgalactosaminyltransferase 2-like isoform X2 [Varroa destructor]XP_022648249.1 UDP-GalNAc:beta-1,3-N-acetylgalactosaminyltransferase 2-like isoform X2 [Varroa destructor]XP_022648250.1 UDP-GalNAc:beta-1,3-N-acetylgalactosaminyltransferase 2-like isoform X2 [Varroa destructor]XP_022648251.1 UDP-GalNAc:beta-1,3-N-acetylgalactosaminyltransferase 2-like isoform X2 [Varroa destructor]XP_022648252.1 UDP-GalNAc:beta-1,3-N-acetylgalactosaminyltransferase 2-like isoform X2 
MMPEHERHLTFFLTVTFAFVGFLIKGFMYYQTLQEAEKGSGMPIVVVAILSERSHLERRKAIRETWLADKGNVKAYFILASKSCNIHPRDRLNDLSCEFFYPNITAGCLHMVEHTACASGAEGPTRIAIGFSFRLRYPVTLTKLGALIHLQNVRVHLIDAVTKQVLSEAVVSDQDEEIGGYRYSAIDPIKFSKNFEGILMVTGNISTSCGASTFQQSDSIEFQRVYYDHVDEHSLPWRLDMTTLSAVSAEIALEGDPELSTLNVLQRRRHWLKYIDLLDQMIISEMNKYKDIVTVDVVETYRNLPRKMSETFAHFSKQSLTFLVKADDDVVLDLPRLKHILTTSLITNRVVWAKTRRAFPISLYGKWAENVAFPSQVYPDFPCGATYVLSKDLVQFIAKNKGSLHHFQGEDVSVGTWLLGLAPQYLGEGLFSCGIQDCGGNVLNRAEVDSPEETRRIWNVYMQNKTLCDL